MLGVERTLTIAVGCGWLVGVLARDTGASGARLVSKTMNVRSITK